MVIQTEDFLTNTFILSLMVFLAVLLLPGRTSAFQLISDSPEEPDTFDHVINRRGESRVSLLTGIPILGTTEYAYGITDHLTVGVFGGFTPFEEAVGLRVRTVLYQNTAAFRIYYCTPVVFYPQRNEADPEPWWLIRPNINIEWLANSGLRYKFGASVIGAASNRQIFGRGASNGQLSPELWTAIHGGLSLPVGKQLSFQSEFSYITKGTDTITNFFGGPPMLAIIGFSYTF